jgi:hypothetical protein
VATTLELSGVKAFALGPSGAYAKSLAAALGKLGSARIGGEGALRRATTRDAQGSAAAELAGAYRAASRALAAVRVSPADGDANAGIVAALRAITRAYGRAASAARAGDDGAYAAATRDVQSGGARLERALKGLEKLGYTAS